MQTSINAYKPMLDHQQPLPRELEEACLKAILVLRALIKRCLHRLHNGGKLLAVEDLNTTMIRHTPPGATLHDSHQSTYTPKLASKARSEVTEFIQVLLLLFDKEAVGCIGLKTMLDSLQFSSHTSEGTQDMKKGKLDNKHQKSDRRHFIETLSNLVVSEPEALSLLCEFLHSIETFFPWAGEFGIILNTICNSETCAHETYDKLALTVESEMATRFRGLDNWYSGNIRFSETVVKPGIPSHNKFDYPMDELRNGTNTKKMITAETNLDSFWNAILTELCDHSLLPFHTKSVWSSQSLHRTPQLEEDQRSTPHNKRSSRITDDEEIDEILPTFSTVLIGNQRHEPDVREEKKTRGQPSADNAETEPETEPEQESEPNPLFRLDHVGMNALPMIFSISGQKDPKGQMVFKDFLYFLSQMGLVLKRQSSVGMVFSPSPGSPLESKGPIQFHMPHGPLSGNKLNFFYARLNGRALTSTYGITGKNFKVA